MTGDLLLRAGMAGAGQGLRVHAPRRDNLRIGFQRLPIPAFQTAQVARNQRVLRRGPSSASQCPR